MGEDCDVTRSGRFLPRVTVHNIRLRGLRAPLSSESLAVYADAVADRLMLLDTASLYFRAFYGVPDSVRAPDGSPVNAVHGLLDIVAKLITLYRPTQIIACWDDDWRPQWRVDLIPGYKGHRVVQTVTDAPDIEDTPATLQQQIPLIREVLGAIRIPILGAAEYEADDVIGTLATHAMTPVDIVTGDRDLFQLVDDNSEVRVIYTASGMSNLEIVTDAAIIAKYGVLPAQYVDFATMRGDASDGLPGVRGVGAKTASTLLQKHGNLPSIRTAASAGLLSPAMSARFDAASDYLDVAPTVVHVAKNLDVSTPEVVLRALDPADAGAAEALAERWNLGGPMRRALDALASFG